ncbi:polymorphic toxin type 50 domain-containing protein [Kribbella sp. NPDC050281]|uniref:polymorphic toxin type 50 domain-containing protein n=1 Tax=Kribbella sp. NPDC050281 TaxID=3155515 RepID=UPI0033C367DF
MVRRSVPNCGEKLGSRERIDFGKTIGIWVGKDGTQMQTTVGILHYKADGSVHIVPAKPNG